MIKTDNLTKRYGDLTAVDHLSFTVEPGEVLGFLGPNGAGKSTTMKMLTGFIAPTSGTASICGHDIAGDPLPAKKRIGYLPEGAPSYGEMSVRGFLEFIARIRGLDGTLPRMSDGPGAASRSRSTRRRSSPARSRIISVASSSAARPSARALALGILASRSMAILRTRQLESFFARSANRSGRPIRRTAACRTRQA